MLETLIIGIVTSIIQVAPGLVAAFTNHETDADALDSLTQALAAGPVDPFGDALAQWKARLATVRAAKATTKQAGA